MEIKLFVTLKRFAPPSSKRVRIRRVGHLTLVMENLDARRGTAKQGSTESPQLPLSFFTISLPAWACESTKPVTIATKNVTESFQRCDQASVHN